MSLISRLPPRSLHLAMLIFLGFSLRPIAAAQTAAPVGALTVNKVLGRAETQDNSKVWRPLNGAVISEGLRTGTGRAILSNKAGGQITVGSASQLRVYSQETDFQNGQFLMDGPVSAFTGGNHLSLGMPGRARVDLTADGSTKRIGVLSGTLRLSGGNKTVTISGGQQINLKTLQVSPFQETDPWYDAQFTGTGEATLEALSGDVSVTNSSAQALAAQIGTALTPGNTLNCGAGAWAEVGFTGGGYLRLTEQSALKVLAVEKTSRGREITLQLIKGSAWNVVQKGQGGYKLSTPVVSTAVRGTQFRVDASGLVKVMEGQVALPSDNGAPVSAGQQKQQGQPLAPLQLDALDRFNALLDAQRAQPMVLRVNQAPQVQNVAPVISLLPNTVVSAQLRNAEGAPIILPLKANAAGDTLTISGPSLLAEGQYTLLVHAKRLGHELQWKAAVSIDRTPPVLSLVHASIKGHILTLTGVTSDLPESRRKLKLEVISGQHKSTWAVNGPFQLQLPTPTYALPLDLELSDAAGNVSHVQLP